MSFTRKLIGSYMFSHIWRKCMCMCVRAYSCMHVWKVKLKADLLEKKGLKEAEEKDGTTEGNMCVTKIQYLVLSLLWWNKGII